MKIFVILPTQLFKEYKSLKEYDIVYLLEDPYYINDKYHKQKLVIYIAALHYYYDYLSKKNINVKYIKFNHFDLDKIINNTTYMYNPIDYPLVKKYNKVKFFNSPLFLTDKEDLHKYKSTTKDNKYSHAEFYKWQRKKLDILMNKDKPLYDIWSFDTENRQKFDKDYEELEIKTYDNKYIKEAKNYISKYFPDNFGSIELIYYPITHTTAESHFKSFLINKLDYFGPVQDAISKDVIYGEHSNISVLLNIGLLTPEYVINKVLDYFYASRNKKNIISSVEGFIRQIIGWREYVRFIYYFHRDDLINSNYFKFTKKMPKSWYDATTSLPILNNMINKVNKYAYLHHIERLLIISNLALLNEIHPKEVYNWFMTCFIDATGEWIMIPNIQMGQHMSNNIKMMKRIYICSDNYIKKMSDYKKEDGLDEIHDLYKFFLKKNKNKLKHDYMLASQLKKY